MLNSRKLIVASEALALAEVLKTKLAALEFGPGALELAETLEALIKEEIRRTCEVAEVKP